MTDVADRLNDAIAGMPCGSRDARDAMQGVAAILRAIGEAPDRDGLVDTPARVVRAMIEMTAGLWEDPADILGRTFDETSDEMVVVDGIDFVSLCEHHLMPFVGTVVVGYLPNGRVVGLSKIPRLVDVFARRLQVQERMTQQIADSLAEHVPNTGVAVVVRATHACLSCRGARRAGAAMVTSSLSGDFKTDPMTRAEFMALARHDGRSSA